MKKVIFALFALLWLATGCKTTAELDSQQMIIASEQGDCVGVAPMKCLLVKDAEGENWTFFYNNIEGFNYEPGYEYVLLVKKENIQNPLADQSSLKYTLVKEVLKVKKTSENLPRK